MSRPIRDELNPNNRTTAGMRDHWHKVAALIMVRLGVREVEFDVNEIEAMLKGQNIAFDERGASKTGKFKIRLVDEAEAAELARIEGGRPIDS